MKRFSSPGFRPSPATRKVARIYRERNLKKGSFNDPSSKTILDQRSIPNISFKGKPFLDHSQRGHSNSISNGFVIYNNPSYDFVNRFGEPAVLSLDSETHGFDSHGFIEKEEGFHETQQFSTNKQKNPFEFPGGKDGGLVNFVDCVHIAEVRGKKDWFARLNQAFDGKIGKLNPQSVVRILQNLENPFFVFKFYIWVSKIDAIKTNSQSVRRVLADILFRRGPVVLSAELVQEIKSLGCRITEDLFCILVNSWGRLGLAKYLNEVFGQISFLGFRPSTRIYNSVIDALVKSNCLDLAYLRFQQMYGDCCYPDRFTYNILIHGVCRIGIVDEALRLLKQMESSGHSPNVFTYTILIDGFCNAKKVEEAFRVLEMMRERNVVPSEATFRSLIHGAFRNLHRQTAYKLLVGFLEGEPVLHENAYNTMLYCLSKNGMAREITEFFNQRCKSCFFPDTSTFNITMACLINSLELDDSCKILEAFCHRGGKPGLDTYVALITALYKAGRDRDSERYVNQIVNDGILCNVFSYNIVIDCLTKAGKMNKASEFFDHMLKKGFSPSLVSFNTLISGHCKAGDINKARELLKILLQHGFKPDVFTFSSIIDGLCRAHQMRDAFDCFNEMVEWGVSLNSVTYNIMIRSLCIVGEVGKSMKLLRKMKAEGIAPDVFSFNALILSFCKVKKLESASNLFYSMLNLGIAPDHYTYNAFIQALCDSQRSDEAKEMVHLMEANGCPPNSYSYCLIINALSCEGCFEEAQELVNSCKERGIHINLDPSATLASDKGMKSLIIN